MVKILVVDDDPFTRKLMDKFLKATHHEVFLATNGPDAIKSVAEMRPDLIFMDIVMPGMDGEYTAKVLKADNNTAGIPIVAFSANRVQELRDISMLYFDHYLPKPRRLDDFLKAVQMFCGLPVNLAHTTQSSPCPLG